MNISTERPDAARKIHLFRRIAHEHANVCETLPPCEIFLAELNKTIRGGIFKAFDLKWRNMVSMGCRSARGGTSKAHIRLELLFQERVVDEFVISPVLIDDNKRVKLNGSLK